MDEFVEASIIINCSHMKGVFHAYESHARHTRLSRTACGQRCKENQEERAPLGKVKCLAPETPWTTPARISGGGNCCQIVIGQGERFGKPQISAVRTSFGELPFTDRHEMCCDYVLVSSVDDPKFDFV